VALWPLAPWPLAPWPLAPTATRPCRTLAPTFSRIFLVEAYDDHRGPAGEDVPGGELVDLQP
jgi:hypothetical protein